MGRQDWLPCLRGRSLAAGRTRPASLPGSPSSQQHARPSRGSRRQRALTPALAPSMGAPAPTHPRAGRAVQAAAPGTSSASMLPNKQTSHRQRRPEAEGNHHRSISVMVWAKVCWLAAPACWNNSPLPGSGGRQSRTTIARSTRGRSLRDHTAVQNAAILGSTSNKRHQQPAPATSTRQQAAVAVVAHAPSPPPSYSSMSHQDWAPQVVRKKGGGGGGGGGGPMVTQKKCKTSIIARGESLLRQRLNCCAC